MSFLDRVTKAVSETVDRGKKEVDQFIRIQKVKGEIGEAEKAIDEARNRIQQIKIRLADAALDMLRAGDVTATPLSSYAAEIDGVEQEIATQQALIAEKKVEIERIKAEDEAQNTVAPAAPPPTPSSPVVAPPLPAPSVSASAPTAPIVPPPLPVPPVAPAAAATAQRLCPECAHVVTETAAFCGECGAKL